MKSILYVGATLMIGASIYGFVDYKNSSQKKEFKQLYNENKVAEPVVENEKKAAVTELVKKPVTKKNVSKKISVNETVPPVKPVKDENRIVTEKINLSVEGVETKIAENKEPVKKIKKKKRLNRELFSRAPIREERIIEEKLIEKSAKKDQ